MLILYEDKWIAVAYKDAGIPSQPDKSGQRDMTVLLSEACGCEIFCVHRLDTPTSGVMVYAKSASAASKMTEMLQASGEKTYLAVARGMERREIPSTGELVDLLYHDKRINKSFVCDKKRSGTKEARLSYSAIAENDGKTLFKIKLQTGRTHQIRVQLASRGFPLLGDGKYGSRDKCPLALACISLGFRHPHNNEFAEFRHLPKEEWYGFDLNSVL